MLISGGLIKPVIDAVENAGGKSIINQNVVKQLRNYL
jgi:hypothetical protein